jgi:hypothetical protein
MSEHNFQTEMNKQLKRLEFLIDDPYGLEALSFGARAKDFISYYMGNFIRGYTNYLREFSHIDLQVLFMRSPRVIKEVEDHAPVLEMDSIIFHTPKTMVGNYPETIDGLIKVLQSVKSDELYKDVEDVYDYIDDDSNDKVPNIVVYGKKEQDKDHAVVSKLFSTVGAGHMTADKAFPGGVRQMREYAQKLIPLLEKEYPRIVKINDLLRQITASHRNMKIDKASDKEVLAKTLMSLAWRLAIYGTVLEHFQQIEYCFTEDYRQLIKTVKTL